MTYPLVSVICLCYNHERFLAEALDSVIAQTYPNIEVVILDDASQDNSVTIILDYCARFPHFKFIRNTHNKGSCTAFNQALAQATGAFIIDFATDDILLPTRIADQVNCFRKLGKDYGAIFTDAEIINEDSRYVRHFYRLKSTGKLTPVPVSGDVYAEVVERYFICTPTLMFRREVYERLQGYDESLAYEDYDFIVRAAREYKFFFLNKVLTKRRRHSRSQSAGWYKPGDKQLLSTIKVCYKALVLNRTERDKQALIRRVEWETQQAFFTQNYHEAELLLFLLKKIKPFSGKNRLYWLLVRYQVNLSFIHRFYYWLVHRSH